MWWNKKANVKQTNQYIYTDQQLKPTIATAEYYNSINGKIKTVREQTGRLWELVDIHHGAIRLLRSMSDPESCATLHWHEGCSFTGNIHLQPDGVEITLEPGLQYKVENNHWTLVRQPEINYKDN